MAVRQAHHVDPALAAYLLENQAYYTAQQRAMAIDSPHLLYIVAARRAIAPGLRRAVYERDNGVCRYCGRQLGSDSFTIDHVFPVAKGGGDEESNLVVACRPCNSSKGSS